MSSSLNLDSVGILGLGFFGKILSNELINITESWGTWHKKSPSESTFPIFNYNWADENCWDSLPLNSAKLVLTIPPVLKKPREEKKRLDLWGNWMKQNRPMLKDLIYISTTGVYPKRNGIWSEDSEFETDTLSGELRLLSEKTLSQYFNLKVIRPGGIYGYTRGIDFRLKSGKTIPLSKTPVHRIHVQDLARITIHMLSNKNTPNCLNAVDLEAKPSWQVAKWLIENRSDLVRDMFQENTDNLEGAPNRVISNNLLLKLNIKLKFPTFREGMGQ